MHRAAPVPTPIRAREPPPTLPTQANSDARSPHSRTAGHRAPAVLVPIRSHELPHSERRSVELAVPRVPTPTPSREPPPPPAHSGELPRTGPWPPARAAHKLRFLARGETGKSLHSPHAQAATHELRHTTNLGPAPPSVNPATPFPPPKPEGHAPPHRTAYPAHHAPLRPARKPGSTGTAHPQPRGATPQTAPARPPPTNSGMPPRNPSGRPDLPGNDLGESFVTKSGRSSSGGGEWGRHRAAPGREGIRRVGLPLSLSALTWHDPPSTASY